MGITRVCSKSMEQQQQEWRGEAIKKFEERHDILRDRHWKRFGSNSMAETEDLAFREELKKFLNGDLFQKIKHRYIISPDTSNDIALISLIAVDYCAGSLEFLLTENSNQSLKVNPSWSKEES